MSIGLFVEGESDVQAISILVRKVLETQGSPQKTVCRNFRGVGNIFEARKIKAHLEFLLKQQPDVAKVIVCVDSHCTDPAEIQKKVSKVERELARMSLQVTPQYVVVVHALEGWLAADQKALGQVLGSEVNINRNLEEECKPEDLLGDLFDKHGKSFQKTSHDPQIASYADPEKIARHSPSFRRFCRLIKDP